jgi:hypothetical protein
VRTSYELRTNFVRISYELRTQLGGVIHFVRTSYALRTHFVRNLPEIYLNWHTYTHTHTHTHTPVCFPFSFWFLRFFLLGVRQLGVVNFSWAGDYRPRPRGYTLPLATPRPSPPPLSAAQCSTVGWSRSCGWVAPGDLLLFYCYTVSQLTRSFPSLPLSFP